MTMRQPPKGFIWVHVDMFGKRDGKLWAVQHWVYGKVVYTCVAAWIAPNLTAYSQSFSGKQQPRAVVEFKDAAVTFLAGDVALITENVSSKK